MAGRGRPSCLSPGESSALCTDQCGWKELAGGAPRARGQRGRGALFSWQRQVALAWLVCLLAWGSADPLQGQLTPSWRLRGEPSAPASPPVLLSRLDVEEEEIWRTEEGCLGVPEAPLLLRPPLLFLIQRGGGGRCCLKHQSQLASGIGRPWPHSLYSWRAVGLITGYAGTRIWALALGACSSCTRVHVGIAGEAKCLFQKSSGNWTA